jgi:hypothetical protein
MEEFGACWEGLEDPRTGNAALHDLHDVLMIALCTVLSGGENATDMAEFAKAKEPLLRGFLRCPTAFPAMTPSAACSGCSIRTGLVPRFSGSWRPSRNNVRVLWR